MSAPPVESGFVEILGHRLFYKSYGKPENGTLLALHGGPGLTHHYLLSLFDLAPLGYRVVLYDQLGCGESDRPRARSEYNFGKEAAQVEGIRRALRLGRVHLFGHSYGGRLALEAVTRFPTSFRSVTFASAPIGDSKVLEQEWRRLIESLPTKARHFMTRRNPKFEDIWESPGDTGFRKYVGGYDLFAHLHVCRLRQPPYELVQSMQGMNPKVGREIYGSLQDAKTLPDVVALARLRFPCLITVGRHDQIAVGVARSTHRLAIGSRLLVFERSSHLPHWEERDLYIDKLRDFLDHAR
jgi:proline iminopeptidase